MKVDVWWVLEVIFNVISMPVQFVMYVANNRFALFMIWAILEVVLEMTMALILAGVSLLVSACLLLDEAYRGNTLPNKSATVPGPDLEQIVPPKIIKPKRKSSCLTTTTINATSQKAQGGGTPGAKDKL